MEFQFPRLADTLVEGTVTRWLKRPGETVRRGEPLVEVETDKVNTELEAPADGVLEIVAAEGETVPVGGLLARIGDGNQAGVAETGVAAPASGLPPLRRRIAERMQEARATIPQGACVREFDLSSIQRGAGWTAYFVKALAAAAEVDNIGVAVEVPGGLQVPVVKDARHKNLDEVDAQVGALAARAREGKLSTDDVAGGDLTLTNVGGTGSLMAFPLVNPGQPAILATGAVRDGGRCYVTLCYDRRQYDDWAADRLLARVEEEMAKL